MFGMSFGLERMERLMIELDRPDKGFQSIHVVGTNGKSSTARMTAAILRRHLKRTGAYLSPHLVRFEERIEIDGAPVSAETFASAIERVAAAAAHVDAAGASDDKVTQFEALTAAAYLIFAAEEVDVAVVEAGLGGRLDATSVICSQVQVLTTVGLDHTALLGDSEAQIAREKLAVVPQGGVLVLGSTLSPDVERIAASIARDREARILRARSTPSFAPAVAGPFQRRNFAVAEAAAAAFLGDLDGTAVANAARSVTTPGRLEVVARDPLTIVDAAHNPQGVLALVEALPGLLTSIDGKAVIGVVSVLVDKDAQAILRALGPWCTKLVLTTNSDPRARDPENLASLVVDGGDVVIVPDPVRAVHSARRMAKADGLVLVTGSIALLSDLFAHWTSRGFSVHASL